MRRVPSRWSIVLGRVGDRASVAVLNTAFWKIKDNAVRAAMISALALSGGRRTRHSEVAEGRQAAATT